MKPETRSEKLLMSFCMSAGMILFMCCVNKFQIEGISVEGIWQVLIHYPLEIVFVMVLSEFIASPLAG